MVPDRNRRVIDHISLHTQERGAREGNKETEEEREIEAQSDERREKQSKTGRGEAINSQNPLQDLTSCNKAGNS